MFYMEYTKLKVMCRKSSEYAVNTCTARVFATF